MMHNEQVATYRAPSGILHPIYAEPSYMGAAVFAPSMRCREGCADAESRDVSDALRRWMVYHAEVSK